MEQETKNIDGIEKHRHGEYNYWHPVSRVHMCGLYYTAFAHPVYIQGHSGENGNPEWDYE